MPTEQEKKLRLWVLDWGLFPRMVTIYLKEKGILDHFEVVPVGITADGMEKVSGKPEGSMPILELEAPTAERGSDGRYIFQSTAILEYLEDVYGPESGTPRMLGATPEERARTRDAMNIMTEAVTYLSFWLHNASALFSGMESQSREAAKAGMERMHKVLDLLDMRADVQGPWLASSGEQPLTVDCVAMSIIQFALHVYHVDLMAAHPSMKRLYESFVKRESCKMEKVPVGISEMAPKMSVR